MRAPHYAIVAIGLAAIAPSCHEEKTSEVPDEADVGVSGTETNYDDVPVTPIAKPSRDVYQPITATTTPATPGSPAGRSTDGWTKIGDSRVETSEDNRLSLSCSDRNFNVLMIDVAQGPVDLRSIVVTYADGTTYTPHLRHRLEEGARSYEMYLPVDRGAVRTVQVDYGDVAQGKEAEIEVWAR